MSLSLTPSKRQHSRNSMEFNGKKFQKRSSFDSPKEPRESTSGADVFRVLCPSSKIESIVEQEENIISQICQETGAIVRINGPIPGCDERVIFVMGPDKEAQTSNEQSNSDNGESKDQAKSESHKDNINANDTSNANDNDTARDVLSDKGTSSVQRALILVLEKFVEGEKQTEVEGTVTFRLLVLSNHVGCLLGRGGSIIKQLSTESGAQIQVLPRDEHPLCASLADDVVQIRGVGDAVKKAIKSVSHQIMENLNEDPDVLPSNSSGPAFPLHNYPVPRLEPQSTRLLPFRGSLFGDGFREDTNHHSNIPPFFPKFNGNNMPSRIDACGTVIFRLLCPDDRVGGVIGKGGAVIKTLKHETGCDIKIHEGSSKGKERIVVVSGPLHPDDKVSAVQDAMRRILDCIAKAKPDAKEKGTAAKFLIPSNEVGCIIGEGGSIISAIRKNTGAVIRFLGEDQLPKSASADNVVVQINGELKAVQEAALQITKKLQHLYLHGAFPFVFSDQAPPFAPYIGQRQLSPHFGPSFGNFDSVGGPPFHGGLHPRNDHPPFMRDVNRHGISESPWPPQSLIEGGPNGFEPHHTQMFGFRGESQQAIFTNTNIEVVVPSSLIPSICGEDGGCLRQIRQISDARIVINDPPPGTRETVIVISGTPEQTNAAHSLIHAFVMIESESSQ